MGSYLSEPITRKETECCEGEHMFGCTASMQGYRVDQEDAHLLTRIRGGGGRPEEEVWMFGVFDGHGGKMVSNLSAPTVLDCFQKHPRVVKSRGGRGGGARSPGNQRGPPLMQVEDIKAALYESILEADRRMRPGVEQADDFSGSTAVVAVVTPTHVVVANCGDSRAVVGTGRNKTVPLSWDHKPTNALELARVVAAGGCVNNGRVDGDLAVSRSLGDYQFKRNTGVKDTQQRVSPEPELTVYRRTDNDAEFLVVACDGVWDIVSNEDCTAFVRSRLQAATPRSKGLVPVVHALLDHCLARGSRDNMTATLVCLNKVSRRDSAPASPSRRTQL